MDNSAGCSGCIYIGLWENEVEYGFPSPCTNCRRRAPDQYTPAPVECDHNKVYSDHVLCTAPPQYPWICSKCGKQGIDRMQTSADVPSYDSLMHHFHPKTSTV